MSLVVRINGWPGTGKLTIARLLAPRLGARLLDNHTLLNPAAALFERGDRLQSELRVEVRDIVLRYARRLPAQVALVFTDALSTDAFDRALFMQYEELAAHRGARLATVVLDISPEENARRLAGAERAAHGKLMSVETLGGLRAQHELYRPAGAIELDVTALSAEEAALALERRLTN